MDEIDILILPQDENYLPHYASAGSAGADVRAFIGEPLRIAPGKTALIPTGLKVQIPHGYEIQVRPRSGLALKNSVTVLNTPGTIDSDYRGEIQVILINHGTEEFIVTPGMRIAQIVVASVVQGNFVATEALACSQRGEGGFGHSGTH